MPASAPSGPSAVLCLLALSFSAFAQAPDASPAREIDDLQLDFQGAQLALHWPSAGPCVKVEASSHPFEGFEVQENLPLFDQGGRTQIAYLGTETQLRTQAQRAAKH